MQTFLFLCAAKEAPCTAEARKLFTQTKGIMFYSVPHRGSSLAEIDLPLLRRSVELMEIAKGKVIKASKLRETV